MTFCTVIYTASRDIHQMSAEYKRGWIGLFIQNRAEGMILSVEAPQICTKGGGALTPGIKTCQTLP